MDLLICGFGAKSRSTVMWFGAKSSSGANLIKENQFSDFYIFRCSGIVLWFSNGLIMHIHLLEVAAGC